MNFTYLDVNILNIKHHIQLAPDDSVSFPVVCGAKKVVFNFDFEVIY